ncbi:efflux RND transporter permease subunit [Pseudoflavonifractor phocaeensis]|uniref:efflux RND transporter permease subunit n=1 Tax=Pseudoflavonifractor phocaeensis TaxID=1870988 RepID=UPI001F2D21C4|nr:efflux RND transporter permease subunit [Pseudoflavonifractor phocaeensis]
MSISKFCIKHKVTTLMAVIMVSIFGVVFTTQLQLALLPDMEAPAAIVLCYYNGASPSDMEELVTRPLESAVMSVSGVESVSSTSSDGVTQVQITYVEGTNLDIAATKLREKFDMLSLPDGAMDPIIVNMNIGDLMPSAMVALMGEDLADIQTLAEETVIPALERVDGVAQVTIAGGVEQQIVVEVDPTRAAGYGLSNSYIAQFLSAENLLYPGGELQNGSQTLTVTTDAKFESVQDVANMILALPTGGTVRLSEVADVRLENEESDTIAKMDGTNCVILQVSKQSGANEVATANAVADTMEQLRQKNNSVVYSIPYLASDYINLAVNAALQNIVLGVILAAIVVFLFLRRLGATATIAVSMPVCILTVFVLMNVFDLTLNMMSLGGVAMGVGMIVDNSIVVLENIYRYAGDGCDRMTACVEGTKEVTLSLTASTLTTVAVFLPLGLSGGIAGMLFDDFCLTISFLILSSLIIAITLVPLLCYFLLDEEKVRQQKLKRAAGKQEKGSLLDRMLNGYRKVLNFLIHHLWVGIGASVALVALFTVACLSTKSVLLPEMDMGMISITVSTPIGSEVEQTAAIADQIAAVAQEQVPELHDLYYTAQSESASVALNLVDKSERTRSSEQVANDLRDKLRDIAGAEITIVSTDMTAMLSGSDISVDITGTDYETLSMIANDLKDQIAQLPDAVDVSTSLATQVPQVKVTMKREAAAQYGLTAASVGSAVRSELTGTTATTVTIDNKELDVVIRGDGVAAANLDALRSMPITTAFGGTVPLSSVANVDVVMAPQTITRVDQSRQVSVTGDTISGDVTAMTREINKILDNYTLPEGYTAQISGAYTDMMESFGDLLLALIVALGLVYFVLASQFESFLMPVIVMMILPVAFTGALFALPLTGRDLSIISLVALIMLAGTVVNASIILVDYIRQRRERGESREEAILHACPLRVRPVLMTTLTTILALVPMAMGMAEGAAEMMSDMSITMISGMVISTVITLIFTPVYYSVIDNISHIFRRKGKKSSAPAGL